MTTLEVGLMYEPGRTSFPQRDLLRLTGSFCGLTRFMSSPTATEIQAHDSGVASFAVVTTGPSLLVLAYDFGDSGWSDSPYRAPRDTEEFLALPTATEDGTLALVTVLVDADTGIIRSLRVDDWPAEFASQVRELLVEQLVHPFDDGADQHKLNELYRDYPTTEGMVAGRGVATCVSRRPIMGGIEPLSMEFI